MNHLFETLDYDGIKMLLENNPDLANEGIAFDARNATKAHPLHRICDGVFMGKYTDAEGVKLAQLFLDHGADVNGGELIPEKDSPLVAAASLHADQVGMLYIEAGAAINHPGCHGGTALHWAAWMGLAQTVSLLIARGAQLEHKDSEYAATPLYWAVHGFGPEGYGPNGPKLPRDQVGAVRALLAAGAVVNTSNHQGIFAIELANSYQNRAMYELLRTAVRG